MSRKQSPSKSAVPLIYDECWQFFRPLDRGSSDESRATVLHTQNLADFAQGDVPDALPFSKALRQAVRASSVKASSVGGPVCVEEWLRRAALYYLAAGAPPNVPEMADDDPDDDLASSPR